MTENRAVAIAFTIAMTVSSAVLTCLRLLLDANGQIMALAMIVLVTISSASFSLIGERFAPKKHR
jgi:hypothetical protein